jgi:hypothetical protein
LFEKVQNVCQEIRNESNLTRVSITEIIKRVGFKKWIDKRKVPKTTQLIDEHLETLEEFMLRKLRKAENYYISRARIPTRQQLIRKAVINNTTTQNSSKIQTEIDETIKRIEMKII